MDLFAPDPTSWPHRLVVRVGKKLRSNKQFTQQAIEQNRIREAERRERRRQAHAAKGYHVRRSQDTGNSHGDVNELGEREHSIFSEASTLVEPVRDHTDLLHRLAHHDSFDSLCDQVLGRKDLKDPYLTVPAEKLRRISSRHERLVEQIPEEVWRRIAGYLSPPDAARLALCSKTLWTKLGWEAFEPLNLPENKHYRIAFLHSMDVHFPRYLLCFPCAKYHLRSQPGKEILKADFVSNQLFVCPNLKASVLPRMRLCNGRELPYSFVQLALRRSYSPAHGIDYDSLSRRWKHGDWSFRTRYMVHDGRLLARIVSQRYVPPAATLTKTVERHLLYDREEYLPFFSVCAHWQDGDLMDLVKCWLHHVPSPPVSYVQQLKKAPKISRRAAHPCFIVRGCDWCRPARRCPECATEYLVEVRMTEDTTDLVQPFKHILVVTRWTDLGDGSSPYTSPEWTAMKGTAIPLEEGGQGYESFSHVGRRAVSGIFESRISGSIPGQRMLNLNPKNKKLGEEGHGWY